MASEFSFELTWVGDIRWWWWYHPCQKYDHQWQHDNNNSTTTNNDDSDDDDHDDDDGDNDNHLGLVELCQDRIVDFLSTEIFAGLMQEEVAYQIPRDNWKEMILEAPVVAVVNFKL